MRDIMNFIFAIILLAVGFNLLRTLIFFILHLRPLSENEVKDLAEKRRKKLINNYYRFSSQETTVDKEFKSNMNPNGIYYEMDEDSYYFPAIVAALMKYKKHEWIVIGFEKDKKIVLMWVNKGEDNSSVTPLLSREEIKNKALKMNSNTVLKFHNHPNSNPNYYDCTNPSKQDKLSAGVLSGEVVEENINYIDFVCERGLHYKFHEDYNDNFYHIEKIIKKIEQENNNTKLQNYKLHRE